MREWTKDRLKTVFLFWIVNVWIKIPTAGGNKAVHHNTSVTANFNGALVPYQPGNVVNGYILKEIIEIAGDPKYSRPLYWDTLAQKELPQPAAHVNYEQLEVSTKRYDNERCVIGDSGYCMDENIFHGGHGDIWRAHKLEKNDADYEQVTYILKRMKTKDNPDIKLCAEREVHFGEFLRGREAFPRLITNFELDGEHWLVFRDEGASLQSYLYNVKNKDGFMWTPSRAWGKLRTTELGAASMKSILFQIISNAAELHSLGIVHRDIKPSNILLQATAKPRLLTSDFSSAVDDITLSKVSSSPLYGNNGPSIAESTLDYAPPEVLLSTTEDSVRDRSALPYDPRRPESYDIWSVGVVFLEMLLGTANVFHVDQRTEALITQILSKKGLNTEIMRKKALLLAGLADFCIYNSEDVYFSSDNMESASTRGAATKRKSSAFSHAIVAAVLDVKSMLRAPNKHHTNSQSLSLKSSDEDTILTGKIDAMTSLSDLASASEHPITVVVDSTTDVYDVSLPTAPVFDTDHSGASVVHRHGRSRNNDGPHKTISTQAKQRHHCVNPSEELAQAILHRDTSFGLGFRDRWGLDLLARLLQFDPQQRISMEDALNHAYFRGAYTSEYDSSEFATLAELKEYHERQQFRVLSKTAATMFEEDHRADDNVDHSKDEGTLQMITVDENDDAAVHEFNLVECTGHDDWSNRNRLPVVSAERSTPVASYTDQVEIDLVFLEHHEIGELRTSYVGDDEIPPSILSSSSTAIAQLQQVRYRCPHCNRIFDHWISCHQHIRGRRHGLFCRYELPKADFSDTESSAHNYMKRSHESSEIIEKTMGVLHSNLYLLRRLLPACLSGHALLPYHSASGWCDLQGRRRYMEDFHSLHNRDSETLSYSWHAIFDGHFGSFSARYAARRMHVVFDHYISGDTSEVTDSAERIQRALTHSFHVVDTELNTLFNSDDVALPIGGTTATVVLRTSVPTEAVPVESNEDFDSADVPPFAIATVSDILSIGHVGDSRLVLCCNATVTAVGSWQITVDHAASQASEAAAVVQRGGTVQLVNGIARVNGQLVVTRALGDGVLGDVISPVPDIIQVVLQPMSSGQHLDDQALGGRPSPCARYKYLVWQRYTRRVLKNPACKVPSEFVFGILASDGLWDVMSNDEAVEMVCQFFLERAELMYVYQDEAENEDLMQDASQLLSYEALVRGSSDNIGVSVIDLIS